MLMHDVPQWFCVDTVLFKKYGDSWDFWGISQNRYLQADLPFLITKIPGKDKDICISA